MVQEVRRIILDKEEMIAALEAHKRMKPDFMPEGKIEGFEIIDDSSLKLIVKDGAQGGDERLFCDNAKLLQPLIRFCLENNIILPRQGQKSVLVAKESVSLCIILDVGIHLMSCIEASRASRLHIRG